VKKLFIAATRQNDGKTSVSLGLFSALKTLFPKIGYMKPVGQQYRIVDGQKIDKDAVLFRNVYALSDLLSDMSPIAVPAGFTERYIDSPNRSELLEKIETAFSSLSRDKDFVLAEGTGHGGVGAVFDMSNGDVAAALNLPVILVTLGGIGKAMDEILLNKAFFESRGCNVIGVIINKVQEDKWDKIHRNLTLALSRHDLPLLGMIPYVPMLTKPTVCELHEELNATLLCGDENINNRIQKFVIGAMLPHDAMDYFDEDTLLIAPANREDLIITALSCRFLPKTNTLGVSAILLTGGIEPHPKILEMVKLANIPLLLVKEDSFTVATKINKLLSKLRETEHEKIEMMQNLVKKHVNIPQLLSLIEKAD